MIVLAAISGAVGVIVTRSGDERAASSDAAAPARSLDAPWQATLGDRPLSGYDSAIALDRDGLPVVAHTEFVQGRLLITRCNDVVCSPQRTRTSPATRG